MCDCGVVAEAGDDVDVPRDGIAQDDVAARGRMWNEAGRNAALDLLTSGATAELRGSERSRLKARLRRMAARQIAHASGGRLPDLPAALALKSWAKFLPGASRERHLQDAVTLLVCTDRQEVALSRSMRSVVRRLLAKIATDEVA